MSSPHQHGPDVPLRPGMSAAAAAVLAETLEVLRRGDRLSTSEIGDHTDLVAELTDALASLSDRLAHDLDASDARDASEVAARGLELVRDGLAQASATARRCAAELYRAHLEAAPSPERPAE